MAHFFDIHAHLLPGVDDGAQSAEEALALLGQASADGIENMLLTPHYRGNYRSNSPAILKERLSALQAASKELPIHLYLGSEIYYQSDILARLAAGEVLTLAGSDYILLEFPSTAPPILMRTGVGTVLDGGYIPILAHVERYACCRSQPQLAAELCSMGALLQINADSVLGKTGFAQHRFCRLLLKRELVHFVASDAHDELHRPPVLSTCFRFISRRYGADYAARLFWENPGAVIQNQLLQEGL